MRNRLNERFNGLLAVGFQYHFSANAVFEYLLG